MDQVSIALLDDYQDCALACGPWERLAGRAQVSVFGEHIDDDDELALALAPFDVVVLMRERTPLRRARLERLPRLRLLVTTGMSNAVVDVAAAHELGITVTGTPGGSTVATAELTWGLLLALARRICVEDRAIREGTWQTSVGVELAGRTLGLIGLGRLGSHVAGYGTAFGMEVIAWSENLDHARAQALGVTPVGKEELLARADVVSVHTRLSERTRGLIAARELALMKPSALLVNTSRGPIVDERALARALTDGAIAGAALDVFDIEPLPRDHPLRFAPNTVLTPHLGYVAQDNYREFWGDVVEDIEAWLAGSPIRLLD
ncbi:MAG: D-2-hydroxyacid dehydrogenase family protein [Solirubrobacteraceae bacterium]|jgi:phosphoglycerate dehydrogenase-like enzyme